jgi:hypothetical protein
MQRGELKTLDRLLSQWARSEDKVITYEELRVLLKIADKNLRHHKMTGAQRNAKSQLHKRICGALADIERMVLLEFIGSPSRWDPADWGEEDGKPPYPDEVWRSDLPIGRLAVIVRRLVGMFGEDYAVPLANALEEGYRDHLQDEEITVEVPIVLRANPLSAAKSGADEISEGRNRGRHTARFIPSSKSMHALPEIPAYIDGTKVPERRSRDLADYSAYQGDVKAPKTSPRASRTVPP